MEPSLWRADARVRGDDPARVAPLPRHCTHMKHVVMYDQATRQGSIGYDYIVYCDIHTRSRAETGGGLRSIQNDVACVMIRAAGGKYVRQPIIKSYFPACRPGPPPQARREPGEVGTTGASTSADACRRGSRGVSWDALARRLCSRAGSDTSGISCNYIGIGLLFARTDSNEEYVSA